MKRLSCLVTALLLLAFLFAGSANAQTQTGTVAGKVLDQQGAVLPGVTVTLTGPRGSQTTVTDAEGNFLFVGVPPNRYMVKAELAGFTAQELEDVVVSMGKTATLDFSLNVGGLTETVEVLGTASTVDVKSASTTSSVSNDLLTAMPIYDSTATGLMNAAPGINSDSAYGGQSSYGNALLLDGVDTRDPDGGSAWTFFDQNLIDEIQIGGLGAPAEYGGFTGGVVNTVTKSGGNSYSGTLSLRYSNDSLASDNMTSAILAENPSLGESSVITKLVDYSVGLGGPIKKDKAFFYASIQRYSSNTDPSGPLKTRTEISPRFNAKVTLQPTSSDTIILGMQYDQYNVTGRIGWWDSDQAIDSATVNEDAPEWVWNAQYRKVFGSSALLEAKLTGYNGFYYLDPVDPAPPTYDGYTGEYGGGGGGLYYADRNRNQFIVSLSKYANAYGRHSFKFGAEIERSHVRSQYQPYGPAGFYIYQYDGVPYAQYSYGYDFQGDNHRISAYAQDQWTVGRLTMNLGLRLDSIKGYSPVLKSDVYTPDAAWGPRIGVAYDLTGKGNTVLKGFWGRYFEGTAAAFFLSATPGLSDFTATYYNEDGTLGDKEVLTQGFIYKMAPSIKHPSTDEVNVSFEQQIGTLRFTATGIYRTTANFVNTLPQSATWDPIPLNNPLTGQDYTGYYWANWDESATDFIVRNIKGYQYKTPSGDVIGTINPERTYKGLMLVLSRSFRNRWGFQASYVLSKAEGNMNNSGYYSWAGGAYSYTWVSPNTAFTNNYGELTYSRPHEIKLYGSYQIPKADVMVSLMYTGYSGTPYTPYQQFGYSTLGIPSPSGRRQISLLPRGSVRNDFYNNLDLRLEKLFHYRENRFGIYLDVMNLTNRSGVTGRQTRYPDTSIGGNTVLYQAPTSVQDSRQATFGLRWTF